MSVVFNAFDAFGEQNKVRLKWFDFILFSIDFIQFYILF